MEVSGVRGGESHESEAGRIAHRQSITDPQGITDPQSIAGHNYRIACCEGIAGNGQAFTDSSAKAGRFAGGESDALGILAALAIRDVTQPNKQGRDLKSCPCVRRTPVLISDL